MVRESSVAHTRPSWPTIRTAIAPWVLPAILLTVFFIPCPLAAHEIAILKSSDIAVFNQAIAGIQEEVGSTATLTVYDLEGDAASGKKIAQKIRASDAAVVIAVGLKAAVAAKAERLQAPVIYCMVLDPEKHDLQGANFTGISLRIPIERQFSTIRALIPKLKRLGVVYDPQKTLPLIEEARRVAKRLGIDLIERPVQAEKEMPTAVRAFLPTVEGLWLVPDSTVLTEDSMRFVLGTALDHNVPVIGFSTEFVRNGALAGLSINPEDIGRQAGVMAKKLLISPDRTMPSAVSPDRVRLSVNLKTAKYLGIVLSPDVMGRADELY